MFLLLMVLVRLIESLMITSVLSIKIPVFGILRRALEQNFKIFVIMVLIETHWLR